MKRRKSAGDMESGSVVRKVNALRCNWKIENGQGWRPSATRAHDEIQPHKISTTQETVLAFAVDLPPGRHHHVPPHRPAPPPAPIPPPPPAHNPPPPRRQPKSNMENPLRTHPLQTLNAVPRLARRRLPPPDLPPLVQTTPPHRHNPTTSTKTARPRVHGPRCHRPIEKCGGARSPHRGLSRIVGFRGEDI